MASFRQPDGGRSRQLARYSRLGVPHLLFQALGVQRQVGTYVVTADGKKFLVNSGSTKQGAEPLTLVLNWPAELKR
jgi:hypothetical protein